MYGHQKSNNYFLSLCVSCSSFISPKRYIFWINLKKGSITQEKKKGFEELIKEMYINNTFLVLTDIYTKNIVHSGWRAGRQQRSKWVRTPVT